jgi:hypothetical protein
MVDFRIRRASDQIDDLSDETRLQADPSGSTVSKSVTAHPLAASA